MVGTSFIELEREKPDLPTVLNDYNIRCLTPRVGSVLQWGTDQRSMVSTRTNPPHQLPGTAGSLTSSESFCQREIRDNDSPENRQHNSCCLHKQDGGDSITYAVAPDKRPVAVVYGKKYSLTSSALTRSIELHCRQGVEDLVRQIRMETQSNTVPENRHTSGTSLNRSVCQQAVNSAPEFCQLEARSTGNGSGCFHSGLGEHPRETICQSPMELGRQSPVSSSQPDGGGTGSSSTSLESTVVVSNVAPVINQQATSHSSVSTSNPVSVSEQSSRHNAPISRVGCIRDRCQSGKLSNTATDLVLSSWRDKSTRSYNSSFNKWARWCAERDRNPISGPISDVANFLADLFEEGYQYRSINVYRSSISTTHDKVDGYSVGQHPTVTRLMRGVFNKRPPLSKYSYTWDVHKVTSYISNLDDNDKISLKLLSLKLVMLLALTRPSRSSDLSSLDLKYMKVLPDGIQFDPAELAKQSRPSKPVASFLVPAFPLDKRLCPKATIQAYLHRTESFRGTGSDRKSKLLLSYVKPHNPITSSSVARWLMSMLTSAGIDTSTFKAHSVRGASVSAAASAGLTSNQILHAADWSSESVFQRFYYKPICENQVGVAVLSTESTTDSLQTSR